MIDATLSSFEPDVIEASMEVPVLVDFWAPWCAPCTALGPLLERLEREYGGRFRLVKVNSDLNPELVASFELKSIPHAVAFVDGDAVAQFMGAQPEPYVRAFLDRIIPDPSALEHRRAREALVQGRLAIAEESLRNALALDPANDGARLDMAGLLLERGEHDAARAHFSMLSPHAHQQSTHAAVRAQIEALDAIAGLPSQAILVHRIAADAGDLQARLDLAALHIARREFEPALTQLLAIVERDRAFGNDIGRMRMLEVFELAAGEPALVDAYRSRLAAILF